MGVYDFGARFFQDGIARFYQPDFNEYSSHPSPVPYAKLNNPQSLNLYTYVLDNPFSLREVDGHKWNLPYNLGGEYYDDLLLQQAADAAGQAVAAQQQSQLQPGRQPDGSYIAPTGPGSEIAKITDPATPLPPLIGNGQCVTACKHFSGITAPTSQWQEGAGVANNGSVPIGTAIATFGSNGKYPTNGDQNSGIYMGQGKNGSILILDQWPAHAASGTPAHPPQIREMRFNDGSTLSNSAQAYHVIIVPAQ
jgi:RHS repeat-associated protein